MSVPVIVPVIVIVPVPVIVGRAVPMISAIRRVVILPRPVERMAFAVGVIRPRQSRVAASAYRAHHTTSMSLIRISSPATGTSRPPPQIGQGSSRSSICTSFRQS